MNASDSKVYKGSCTLIPMEDLSHMKDLEKAEEAESNPAIHRSSSSVSMESSVGNICRICHCGTNTGTSEEGSQGGSGGRSAPPDEPLISPCHCSGTLKFVHQGCLQQWIKSGGQRKRCELCNYEFEMTSEIKPFRQWKKLNMTTVERRKVLCSVTFHVVAITCVIWSLYVLIDRTRQEVYEGNLHWPFWTKLVVVAIGFTGGLVFMYVQCKMYVQLFRKWKDYNRVIYILESNLDKGPSSSPEHTLAETPLVVEVSRNSNEEASGKTPAPVSV